jgi:hypothetical protein
MEEPGHGIVGRVHVLTLAVFADDMEAPLRSLAAVVAARGPKSASARPGPCTQPRSADALTRREIPPGPTDAGVKLVRPRPPAPPSGDGQAG